MNELQITYLDGENRLLSHVSRGFPTLKKDKFDVFILENILKKQIKKRTKHFKYI